MCRRVRDGCWSRGGLGCAGYWGASVGCCACGRSSRTCRSWAPCHTLHSDTTWKRKLLGELEKVTRPGGCERINQRTETRVRSVSGPVSRLRPEGPGGRRARGDVCSRPVSPSAPDRGPRYEVMFFLESEDAEMETFRQRWDLLGEDVAIEGEDGLWNCHIHTDDIGGCIEAGIEAGRPRPSRIRGQDEGV